MNPRVLLRSSRHPSSATSALPSQPRQLLKSSVSQSLVNRLLHSPGSGVGTGPSAQFQNSFLFASAGKSGEKSSKRGFSSAARKQTGEKKDTEGNGDKGGDGSTGRKIKAPEPEEKKEKSAIPEKPYTKEPLPCPKTNSSTTPSAKPKGKLLTTPFRTLKLLLPLTGPLANSPISNNEYLVLLVHPQQPLSTLIQLIQAELPPLASDPPREPRVTFKAVKHTTDHGIEGGFVRWSSSTEIEDFVLDVVRVKEFIIEIEDADDVVVSVPTFKERSYFLREKLRETTREIDAMVKLREGCDFILQRSARRAAVSGLFCMVGSLVGVYWLTFETTLGWTMISPITYLVGISIVLSSYLFFLYSNHSFSQRAIMESRQQKLYESRGFDQDRLSELVDTGKALRKEILAISEQYGESWDEEGDEVGGEKVKRLLKGDHKVVGSVKE